MRTKIFLVFILLSLLSSCGKKNQTEARDDKSVLAGVQITKNSTSYNLVDSLKQIIKNLSSTDYDLKVMTLKGLPEYKNALFLTPKENKEYLALVKKNSDRFKTKTRYWNYAEKNWRSFDDTTLIKTEISFICKIVFDTTQTIRPLLSFTDECTELFRDKKDNKKCLNYHQNVHDYYYIPKFQIGYIIIESTDIYGNSPSRHSYLTSYESLDMQIRSGFQTN